MRYKCRISDPAKPPYVRVLFGLAAAILVVGIVLVLFVGGPGPLVLLAGVVVYVIAALLGRQRH